MADARPADRLRENATRIATVVVTGAWLALLVAPVPSGWWLAALLFGYTVVVPLVALLVGDGTDQEQWWRDDDWWDWSSGEQRDAETGTGRGSVDHRRPSGRSTGEPSTGDALETLRERYARGELTDEQFESKLERLLDTETVESAEAWARAERGRERERE